MENKELLEKAKEVSKSAYAKYSNFCVGACVEASSGKTYVGCNMENASYGLGICAERNAIANAIANGERELRKVAIYSPNSELCFPCGACRQVIFEFQNKDYPIEVVLELKGEHVTYPINDLLPYGFVL